MISLNHIFLFLALVSPIAVLVRSWRVRMPGSGWRIASAVVLAITAVAWLIMRGTAGYVGAIAWFALLFLPAIGLRRMTELSARHQYRSARRLAKALHWLHPSADLRDQIGTLHYLEMKQSAGALPLPPIGFSRRSAWTNNRLSHAPAVVVLIIANVLAFGVELVVRFGTGNDGSELFRLGSLVPLVVVYEHQYWRLVAALFLHANLVHLLFNVFALYVIGPQLENFGGSLRFFVCYFFAGICSTAGVVLLWRLGIVKDVIDAHGQFRPLEVVGASGCIMGVVGALAGFLLRNRKTAMAQQRLGNIIMIVVIQTLFDLSTPEVSMSAHLCGLVGGVLIGLIVAPGKPNRDFDRRSSF